jgi:peptidoglycan/LPS O-acetylase OafA/YrhL
MTRIAGFDGIRGLAVLMVLLSHTHLLRAFNAAGVVPESVFPMLTGWTGVAAFFILSGYLITYLLIREQQREGGVSIGNFWARRALRIFPVYFLCLVPLAAGSLLWNTGISNESFLHAFTYLYNFIPREHYSTTLGHTWSLAVEEHFYLIWPFVFVAVFTRSPRALMLVLVAAIAASHVSETILTADKELTETYFVGRWSFHAGWWIAYGCLLALLTTVGHTRWRRLLGSRTALCLGIALYASSLVPELPDAYLRVYGLGLGIAWIVLNQQSWPVRLLEFRPLAYLGTISYGVYMYHGVFIATGPYRAPGIDWPPPTAAGLLMLMVVAPLSYHYFEKPLLTLKDRYFRKGGQSPDGVPLRAAE